MRFSERVSNVKESATLKFTQIIEDFKKKGKEVIDFAVGELDFPVPSEIINSTKNALDENKTRYCNVSGINELKKAIVISQSLNEKFSEKNVLVTNGSKQALYNIFQVLCNKGDEVLLPKPYWVSFPEQIRLSEGKPVIIDTKNHQLDIEKIKDSITKKTKAIIINSPNNPTGAVYKNNDLKAIADLAIDNDFYVISDEAYEMLVYDGLKHCSIMSVNKDVQDRVILVKSFSKSFSMTGFRVGFAIGNQEIISAMSKVQSHSTGNVCTFAQYGAIKALELDTELMKTRSFVMEKKRDLVFKLTTKLFECVKPQGAFYLFPRVKEYFGNEIKNSQDFSEYILEKASVALVAGGSFGSDDNVRISYALPDEKIKKGFESISKVL